MIKIGEIINQYEILAKLGEGGMGVVYRARDTRLKRDVAIKFMPPHVAADADEKERFNIEAQAAAALNHANIATIHNIEEVATESDSKGQFFIVMEFVEGRELREYINDHKEGLPLDEALEYARQIADGLYAAHKKGIVHRDIKSANIMVTPEKKVKIMDFGLAKIRGDMQLTKAGTTLGTVSYMSPEQAKGEEVDPRSDIFSLGVLLYEMLTGQLPFQGDYEQAVIYAILNESPPSTLSLRPEIPKAIEKSISKALSKKAAERYQTASDLQADLQALSADQSLRPGQASKPGSINKAYLAIGSIIIVAIVLVWFWRPGPDDSGSGDKSGAVAQYDQLQSLAVLPFSNLRSDPETDYLGYAVADQVIGALTYFERLIVRPSSSIRKYENQVVDLASVASDLDVEYVLTGNFLREADQVRLNIELVNVASNEMVWRNRIELPFENVFKLQDMVADSVIQGLKIQLSEGEEKRKEVAPSDPLAYELFLRAIALDSDIDGDLRALELIKASVAADSNYAPALDELAFRTHRLGSYELKDTQERAAFAERTFKKALSINPTLLSALGNLANFYVEIGELEKAHELVNRMLEINPNNALAHFSRGYIYRYAGLLEQARDEMEMAVALDPKDVRFRSLGITYYYLGEYDKALKTLDIDKGSAYSLWWQGWISLRLGKHDIALKFASQVLARETTGLFYFGSQVIKAIIEDDQAAGLAAANSLEQTNPPDGEIWTWAAVYFASMGDSAGCVRALKKAVDMGFYNYPFLRDNPYMAPMRTQSEFRTILEHAKAEHEALKRKFR